MDASVFHSTNWPPLLNKPFQEQSSLMFVDAMFILVSVIGILDNSLVLLVFARMKELRTITNLLIINQSLLDLAASIFLLFRFIPMIAAHFYAPLQGNLVCIFLNDDRLFWTAMMASTYNLVLITLERYFAVVHPTRHKTLVTYKRLVFTACVPFFIGLLYISPLLITSRVGTGGECTNHFIQTGPVIFAIVTTMVNFVFPLGCIILAYIRIFKSLQTKVGSKPVLHPKGNARCVEIASDSDNAAAINMVRNDVEMNVPSSYTKPCEGSTNTVNTLRVRSIRARGDEGAIAQPPYRNRARKNVISTLLIVSLTFCICWTPNSLFFVVHSFKGAAGHEGFLFDLTKIIVCCNLCANPFIYTFKYRQFRKALKKLCHNER